MATTKLLDRSVIFYEGPSLIDGSPILGIATASTSNPKTGPMVQTWILSADLDPWAGSQNWCRCVGVWRLQTSWRRWEEAVMLRDRLARTPQHLEVD